VSLVAADYQSAIDKESNETIWDEMAFMKSAAVGYLALAAGAACAGLILSLAGSGPEAPLGQQQWVQYWSTLTFAGTLISAFGGIAGAIVISGQRSVLTTGVMITLALIPSMALVGLGLITADWSLAGRGILRWLVDVVLVMLNMKVQDPTAVADAGKAAVSPAG
jgi:uncharacterized membrane protein